MTDPVYGDASPAYSPPAALDESVGKVRIQPIQLMQRAHQLMGEQFWLFVGITFVGMLLASLVPLGILMGPMMIGIYYCFMDREAGRTTSFDTLFRGFEQFAEALVATLIMIGLSFLVMLPLGIILFLLIVIPAAAAGQNGGDPPPAMFVAVLVFYPIIILTSILVYLPFVFTFQLIADRKLKAWDAVKLSARAVFKNLLGIFFHFFVIFIVSFLLTMMCYFPVFIFMPISFGSLFVLYRDIFGAEVVAAEIVG